MTNSTTPLKWHNRVFADTIAIRCLIAAIAIYLSLILANQEAHGQSLNISKSVSATAVNPNTVFTYTIQYNCTSITNPCSNVVITDRLPSGLTGVTLLSQGGTTSYNETTRLATFNLGTLPAGTTGQVQIQSMVASTVPGGTVLPNSATITSGATPVVSNSVTTTVNTRRLGSVTKAASSTSGTGYGVIAQGTTGYYSFNLSNDGNTSFTNLCLEDASLPLSDKLKVTQLQTGRYTNTLGGAVPSAVTISYKTNLQTAYQVLTGSPFSTGTSQIITPSLAANEYITDVQWCFNGAADPGFRAAVSPAIYFTVAADADLGSYQNCGRMSDSNGTISNTCTNFTIKEPINGAITDISKGDNSSNAFPGDTVTQYIDVSNAANATEALQNGVIHDGFLAQNFEYIPNSFTYTGPGTPPTFTTTGGNGYSYLNWTLTTPIPPGGQIRVAYKLLVKSTATGLLVNRAAVFGSNIYSCTGEESIPDSYDLDQDGNIQESLCIGYSDTRASTLALLKSEKLVKGQLDAAYSKYPAFGQTVPGGIADYRLRVSNEGNVAMKNIIVIDVLPYIGDKGVLDTQDRLTQWRPNLAGPVTPPTGVTVYYSTQSNPCRPELNFSPSGCTTANWSTVPPTDITTVQSLKFDFGSIVIQPGDSLFLAWPMRAPFNAPTSGEIAWNSFGYVATRNDNNTQLLPAEPIKVGIKVNPPIPAAYGDFVWLDTDQDGIQDSGETGVSGVRVELYQDNGDGVPDKTTDTFVGFTVTDASGHYLFSSLNPGDYFAVFYPPSGYAVSPSLVGTNKAIDSEGIITAVTHLDASETDLTWDLGIYPSTNCDVNITNTTVSPCSYSGGVSRATVNVFVTWANPPAGQNITVSLAGASSQTINVTGGATSPALLTFTLTADGATHAITASFGSSTACTDQTSILAPQPCAPAVCALGITNVQTGACSGSNRQVNATVSWSNNPVGENIIVLWDGVPVDTILVSGGLGSPQPTSFYAVGGTSTHTLTARFASTTTCAATVSGISVPACAQPCGVALTVTPGLCQSATNSYVLSGTVTTTNVPVSGTMTISSTAFSPRSLTLPAGNASGVFSYSGLVSNGQTYTVTTSYSNSACAPVSQTYTAPASCSVAAVCSLSATVTAGLCATATNTYSATAVVRVSNPTAGTLTVTTAGQSLTFATTASSSATYTAVFNGLVSDGASHTVTASLPGCSTATTTYTAPASCSAVSCEPPIHVCKDSNYSFELTVPTGQGTYQWYRNGQPIANATTNSYTATQPGSYSLAINGQGGCPNNSCCPVVIVEDSIALYQAQAQAPTCHSATNTANNNGSIVVTNWKQAPSDTATYYYQVSLGSSFNSAQIVSGSPTTQVPSTGLLVNNLPNPTSASGQVYTVRIQNGPGCYRDVVVTLPQASCECPPAKCVPFVITKVKR